MDGDAFLSHEFHICYTAELLESNLALICICVCMLCMCENEPLLCIHPLLLLAVWPQCHDSPSSYIHLAGVHDPQPPLDTCRMCVAAGGYEAVSFQAAPGSSSRWSRAGRSMAHRPFPKTCRQLPSTGSGCRGLSCFWIMRSWGSFWTWRNLQPQFLLLLE